MKDTTLTPAFQRIFDSLCGYRDGRTRDGDPEQGASKRGKDLTWRSISIRRVIS